MIEIIHALPELADAEENVFEANEQLAEENQELLRRHHLKAIDFMGALGCGKTTLITRLVERLKPWRRVAVMNGGPVTAEEIEPIARQGVPVIQIGADASHLDAALVARGYDKLPLDRLDLIFIENLGNVSSPDQSKLGTKARVVAVSVTEGPWMIRKHPRMILGADLVVINKVDLAAPLSVDVEQLKRDIHTLKPTIEVIVTSCVTGEGLDSLANALLAI